MSKQQKIGLMPKLRFPQFRESSEWEADAFCEIYDFKVTNSFSRDMLTYKSGSVKNIHYGDIHTKFSTLFNIKDEHVPFINSSVSLDKIKQDCYCVEGDIIFADASEDLADIGKSIELVNLNNERLLSGLHTILARQRQKKIAIGFGGYLFKSQRIRKQIQKESQGTKVLGLSVGRLAGIEIAYPSDQKEQQKIANCLSSIDELITAQSQKIETLKEHKKGLMQQLFPAEGETIPKLRFPEFQGREKWQEKSLNQISNSIFDGTHQTPTYTEEGIPFFSVENIVSRKLNKFISRKDYLAATSRNKPEKGDLLITRIGNIGFTSIVDWDYEFSIYVTLAVVKSSGQFDSYYLHGFMQSERYQTEIRSKSLLNAVPCKINMDELRKTIVLLPSAKEQQKIANCLSSIDELITAQSQKIETLKEHKKGLMQQLFPVINKVI
ncbi:restriction endonuclease subunit S [Yersinia aleksiciae]|uniref:restriction endonuclease subunit S n=1 Tax=Yersinia aleksiciae TaxID=263819 RepID=UPI0025AB09DF|nr:restriction endonuclease subunit S [Yersinia aleksiciae]MDN0122386.1 restriction endonuclease subunit S [Yersinia aleksiciae]